MRRLHSVSLFLLCAAFSTLALTAQSPANLPRISGPINSSKVAELRGNVPFLAKAQFDRGEAQASQQLGRMRLVLTRSAAQEAALEAYLAQLQDKSSPNYHKWLTPEQYGKLYGPADSDLAAMVAWLQSRGLTVDTVLPARTTIAFTGTVRQVEDAFHTSIHSFEANGQQFTANTVNPRIPAALTPLVSGVAGLNTYRPQAHSIMGKRGYFDGATGQLTPVKQQVTRTPRADLTLGSAKAGYSLYIVPGDAATIYDTPNTTFNANYSTGTSYTGSGVTIGIGGDSAIQGSTVASYRTLFLGNSTAPTISYCSSTVPISCSTDATSAGVTTNGDIDEAYLDNELSGGLAPGATIHYYASDDLWSGIEQAVSDNTVDIFSLSFGLCELFMDTADNAFISAMWQQAAAQGIAVTVSTGDSGSAVCDNPNTENVAQYGLQVSGFASTPYNIAVGGTDLSGLLTSFSTYAGTSSSTSGTAGNYYRSALKYIPESTWNDSVLTNGAIANNQAYTYTNNGVVVSEIVAGSGGASACSTNTTTYSGNNTYIGTCTSGYAKPTWQRGTGVPADKVRDLPDISLMAGDGVDYAGWLVCTDDRTTNSSGAAVTDNCTQQSDGYFYFNAFGGTSTSTPAFAGMLALVQQSAGGGRLGQAAKELYDLYNGAHAASIFHDTTTGNNSVPCTSGTPNCTKNSKSQYFESGYNTTAGYDLATGMGSVDVANLVKYWGTGTGEASSTMTVTPTPSSITTLQSLSVAVTVTGTSGTPTGTLSLRGGGYTSATASLTSGAYTFAVPPGSLAAGSDTLSVFYSGDTNYSVANQTASVTVTKVPSSVTVLPASTSIMSNAPLTVTGKVSGAGATPTGTVTLSSGTYSSAATTIDSTGAYSITVPSGVLTVGPDVVITATYSGDNTFAGSTNSATIMVVGVVLQTPAITVTPSTTTIDSAQTLSVAVTVSGSSGTPTGTVVLMVGSYNSGNQALSGGAYTFTVPANNLPAGTDTITIRYNGDSVYKVAAATTTVTVTASDYTLSASSPAAVAPGGSATSTITVTSATNYSGTVTLTCALTSSPSGATELPTCTPPGSGVALSGTSTSGTGTVTVSTTAASAALHRPFGGWAGAGGGAVLALMVFFGIPARRRSWRAMLGAIVLLMTLGSMAACGGGSSGTKNAGTTAGTYTFTVTGTGSPAVTPAPTTTFTVTVN